jgi:hypothetical protein
MSTPMRDVVKHAMVDISQFPVELADGKFGSVSDGLTAHLIDLVDGGAGLAVCYGTDALLARHSMDIHGESDAAAGRDYLESIFRTFAASVDVAKRSPVVMGYDRVASMDVDGYNKNTHFTPNADHTESREFLTTKCVHFDAATPFIGNVYGPYTNITGGRPIVCDTREFCLGNGIDPADLLELMPHSYNVAVKQEYADRILEDHSAVVDVDLLDDMILVVLNNEVAGGLAHAGSAPQLADPAKPGRRPLRHIEFQFPDGEFLHRWYRHYRLDMPVVKLSVPDPGTAEHERYHRGVTVALATQAPVTSAG